MSSTLIPVFYAVAMGVGGMGSLIFGRLFDRVGIVVLIPLTLLSALFAPPVFLGGFWAALVGVALWRLGMGVHESIIPAAVGQIVPALSKTSHTRAITWQYSPLLTSQELCWLLGATV